MGNKREVEGEWDVWINFQLLNSKDELILLLLVPVVTQWGPYYKWLRKDPGCGSQN